MIRIWTSTRFQKWFCSTAQYDCQSWNKKKLKTTFLMSHSKSKESFYGALQKLLKPSGFTANMAASTLNRKKRLKWLLFINNCMNCKRFFKYIAYFLIAQTALLQSCFTCMLLFYHDLKSLVDNMATTAKIPKLLNGFFSLSSAWVWRRIIQKCSTTKITHTAFRSDAQNDYQRKIAHIWTFSSNEPLH